MNKQYKKGDLVKERQRPALGIITGIRPEGQIKIYWFSTDYSTWYSLSAHNLGLLKKINKETL